MADLPVIMTKAGAVATPVATIRQAISDEVAAIVPGYTSNLPASLIEDILSTDVYAVAQLDQARVDAINSISPYGANGFILSQQGAMLGIYAGEATATSVYVVFTNPDAIGYLIPAGFVVSDGAHQYAIQDGGVINAGGSSQPLLAICTDTDSFSIPPNTVTDIVTSLPAIYAGMTVTNPTTGTPGTGAESLSGYRARVIQGMTIAGQGTAAYIKTLVGKITGVNSRLISVVQVSAGWKVIVGGSGDPYQIAAAIYEAVLDLNTITGSLSTPRNITVSIIDYPNTYNVTFVNPVQATVGISLVWKTNIPNYSQAQSVANLGVPAIQDYINSIVVGQPLNLLEISSVFETAIASILPTINLSALNFTVTINGSIVSPPNNSSLIASSDESYFEAGLITIAQG